MIARAPLATLPVTTAAAALALVLTTLSGRYGYHRDELYFRMLPAAWGYVDQPPLTPWLARTMAGISDQLWVLRLPATLLAVVSVFVIALVVAEVGGSRRAQGLAAWGYAFGTLTLTFGHVLLTASFDLLVWPTVILMVMRVVLRQQPRWWWPAGLVIGLSTYNKWLITMLVIAVLVGILVTGPRRVLASRALFGSVALAVIVALPNIIWQLRHGVPQLEMGAALAAQNATDVRISTGPMLFVMVGPPMVPFIVAGVVRLLRAPDWRPLRFIPVALAVSIIATVVGGTQFYYPYPLLAVTFALGCVPVAAYAARSRRRAVLVLLAVVLQVIANIIISTPVLPLPVLVRSFVPAVNSGVSDQIGWPAYVAQIDGVVGQAQQTDPHPVIFASNYGEAGALARFSGHPDVRVVSAHNALWDEGPPPAEAVTTVVVGGQLPAITADFGRCDVIDHLASGVDVDNEEEGQPVAICTGPTRPWAELWPTMRHLG